MWTPERPKSIPEPLSAREPRPLRACHSSLLALSRALAPRRSYRISICSRSRLYGRRPPLSSVTNRGLSPRTSAYQRPSRARLVRTQTFHTPSTHTPSTHTPSIDSPFNRTTRAHTPHYLHPAPFAAHPYMPRPYAPHPLTPHAFTSYPFTMNPFTPHPSTPHFPHLILDSCACPGLSCSKLTGPLAESGVLGVRVDELDSSGIAAKVR